MVAARWRTLRCALGHKCDCRVGQRLFRLQGKAATPSKPRKYLQDACWESSAALLLITSRKSVQSPVGEFMTFERSQNEALATWSG